MARRDEGFSRGAGECCKKAAIFEINPIMKLNRIFCAIALTLVFDVSIAGAAPREAAGRAKAEAAKKAGNSFLADKPVAPVAAPVTEEPAKHWSGFYFGLDAGAAASETNR
ncbi:hypothetical protein [Methylocystis parvus]|uniref:Uncharacterized protein n=1 Tax=Methylocystis parvus TaxID=134 RepID=A0A6B8M1P6_9HYPH|nr:hypothetical protein [Methylocystis parvus]QGM96186.1 hypothetical protein F7D14_00895 [Methylocystis parvus]WBJ99988.1 hypothetical protein MMG94_18720 [Methylocystis parvus OBBP]